MDIERSINKGGRPKREFTVDGQALTVARINAGMSLSDVAEKLRVNRATVSRWERNIQAPKAEDILRMMTLYRADFRVIAGGGENE